MHRFNNQDLFGQHHSLKYTTNSGGTTSAVLQDLTYSKYGSQQTQKAQETSLRINDLKEDAQDHTTTMEVSENRCVCSETQQSTSSLLESSLRFRCSCKRCLPTETAEEEYVFTSTLETAPDGIEEDSTGKGKTDGIDYSMVAEPILVVNGPTNETFSSSNPMEIQSQLELSRLEIINNFRKKIGLNENSIDFLTQQTRSSTRRAYDNGWNHWVNWCRSQTPTINDLEYNPQHVFQFLMDIRRFRSTHLNALRSAIASVFSVIPSKQRPIADQPIIRDFFTAKRKTTVKIPKDQQLSIWDADILLQHIKAQLSPSIGLYLQQLQVKIILLLCIATIWHPRLDISRLQRDIYFLDQDSELSVTIHVREPKESQEKSTKLGCNQDDSELCAVQALEKIINKMKTLRSSLPEDHTLFLTHLDSKQTPSRSVCPSTVAN
ncbi:hypothetical protein G6F37_007617 [Rhizopus arrhizus]|nr:hypothetical protein G6F38_007731 [Rhizopus arrhizus]KAG1156424.1 hypothetical protein G6F37_007617 [Rhizopus arrhizus]